MLSTVAVVPEPPLLVPELAAGAAAETVPMREAVLRAGRMLAAAAPVWIAVGADARGRQTVPAGARGTFAGYGVDLPVALGTPAAGPVDTLLALPMLVAGWVAARAGRPPRVRGELVAPDAPTAECAAVGAELAAEAAAAPGAVGLLVVGDGAATHTEKAPGHLDPRAAGFDAGVAAALRTADPAALAALDPGLAAELLAGGRAPWQVLAGAAAGAAWSGELLYSGAPYGVAYHVALWSRP